MYLKDLEPELRDEVKSKIVPDMAGIVIAKYSCEHLEGNFLDIRLFNERIYYKTPAKNWEVIKINAE